MPRRKFCHFHVKPFVSKCQTRVYSQDVNVLPYVFLCICILNLVYKKYIEKSEAVDHYFCKNKKKKLVM